MYYLYHRNRRHRLKRPRRIPMPTPAFARSHRSVAGHTGHGPPRAKRWARRRTRRARRASSLRICRESMHGLRHGLPFPFRVEGPPVPSLPCIPSDSESEPAALARGHVGPPAHNHRGLPPALHAPGAGGYFAGSRARAAAASRGAELPPPESAARFACARTQVARSISPLAHDGARIRIDLEPALPPPPYVVRQHAARCALLPQPIFATPFELPSPHAPNIDEAGPYREPASALSPALQNSSRAYIRT